MFSKELTKLPISDPGGIRTLDFLDESQAS